MDCGYSPHLPRLHLSLQSSTTLVGCDVMHQSFHVRNRADRQQVDADDNAPTGHELRSDLAPTARSSTEVNTDLGGAEEVILLVNLRVQEGLQYRVITTQYLGCT